MYPKIHLDFETRSAAPIRKTGAVRYAMDSTTEILLARWIVEERMGSRSAMHRWDYGDAPPQDLIDAVAAGATVCAHNAMFELAIWTYVAAPRMGWGPLRPDQMDCTMARAYVMSLPGTLEQVGDLLHTKHRKNPEGKKLIGVFSVPRKLKKGETADGPLWNEPADRPEEFSRFGAYCEDDVLTECAIDAKLPQLSPSERETYHFDLKMNLRGFRLDTATMRKAVAFLDVAKGQLNAELAEVTEGAVGKTTQPEALKTWLNDRGVKVTTLRKGDMDEVIELARANGDEKAERALELRRAGAKATSLAKFQSGLNCAGFDGRARGLFSYHKASTGRWAGSLYQPHNLERIDPERDGPLVERMLQILHDSDDPATAVTWCMMDGMSPMNALGKCTRAMILAEEGSELIVADYSNVEGRGSAWAAGEAWKVKAFRDYDLGAGQDLYQVAYGKSFGVDPATVTKPQRQLGKVQELALGYQGGVGAFMSMALLYGVDPDAILHAVKPVADPALWVRVAEKYDRSPKFDLEPDQWTALRYVVDAWRLSHPNVVQGWWDLQDAFIEAVSNPGEAVSILGGKVRVYCTRNQSFVHLYLPSGRPLSYFRPRVKTTEEDNGFGGKRVRRSVVVEGKDSRKGSNYWGDVHLYGGLEWENMVQGMCRDILVRGLKNCEAAGYPVVLHVHDEGVFEVRAGHGSIEEVQALMAQQDPWTAGFPLSSKAGRDVRYVK